MAILKKNLYFASLIILLILIAGCSGKQDTKNSVEEIRTGAQGLVISFLPNNPPDRIHVERSGDATADFDVVLEARNKGAYPQPEDRASTAPPGRIYLSGFDPNIISFEGSSVQELSGKALEGKSTINPNGGLDFMTFKGKVHGGNLNVEKYEPTLLATACYYYSTVAGPPVCIDPDPYSTITTKKVCQVQSVSLTNQGAPVAIAKIDVEAFAKKTQFKITIKNAGGGEVIHYESLNKCGPIGDKLGREDIDKVYLLEARVGTKLLNCGPFSGGDTNAQRQAGNVRLINGEGSVICELPSSEYSESKAAYTTPMTINLIYGYRTTTEKKLQIKTEPSGPGSSSPTTPAATPSASSTPSFVLPDIGEE